MKTFRLLRADEIECRVSRCSAKGAVLLLYKTARTDADLLDETFGPECWENDFKLVDGVLYGGIGIHFNDGRVIWKWDAGVESNTEAEKGRASDAFKRAGFKWGLGRELYSAPFTFIPAGKCNISSAERGGKTVYQCYDDFEVLDIAYDENERICYLRIGLKGLTVFEWGEYPAVKSGAATCDVCGRPVTDGKKRDGSVWAGADIAQYTKLKYGRTLCYDCAVVEGGKK